jgi:hypothetical protein
MSREAEIHASLVEFARSEGQTPEQALAYANRYAPRQARTEAEGYPEVDAYSTGEGRADFKAQQKIAGRLWSVSGELARNEAGALVIGRFEIEPLGHRSDVTTSVLRDVKLSVIRDRAARTLREQAAEGDALEAEEIAWPQASPEESERLAAGATLAATPSPPVGRPSLGEEHYRAIAVEYLAAVEARMRAGRSAYGLLTELAAGHYVSRETMRDWIKAARKRGFIAGTSQGRSGGEPGPNLNRREK